VSIGWSVLLHGALVGLLVYGYIQFRRPPPPLSALAIDATVVSQATLDAARRSPAPAPIVPPVTPPPEALPTVPPPDPAAREAAAQAQAEHEAAAQRAEAAQAQAAAQRAADQLAARRHAEAAAQREADEARASAAKAEREAQAKAKAKAAEELAARKTAAQAAANQADLQRSIAAEERLDAARASGAMSSWAQQIQARIERAWIKPPSARSGIDCVLNVTQVPGGVVTDAKLGACNGDDAVKQSILDAVYRASPLPAPPDPNLFERNLELNFRPTD
jgi:colicin import membrane protein